MIVRGRPARSPRRPSSVPATCPGACTPIEPLRRPNLSRAPAEQLVDVAGEAGRLPPMSASIGLKPLRGVRYHRMRSGGAPTPIQMGIGRRPMWGRTKMSPSAKRRPRPGRSVHGGAALSRSGEERRSSLEQLLESARSWPKSGKRDSYARAGLSARDGRARPLAEP